MRKQTIVLVFAAHMVLFASPGKAGATLKDAQIALPPFVALLANVGSFISHFIGILSLEEAEKLIPHTPCETKDCQIAKDAFSGVWSAVKYPAYIGTGLSFMTVLLQGFTLQTIFHDESAWLRRMAAPTQRVYGALSFLSAAMSVWTLAMLNCPNCIQHQLPKSMQPIIAKLRNVHFSAAILQIFQLGAMAWTADTVARLRSQHSPENVPLVQLR